MGPSPFDALSDLADAEAYAAGVTVFATRDDRLLQWARTALDISGIRVMRPADVVL
jgi:hypothetical protein